MTKKRQTIVLALMAVMTLISLIVGSTFAYFTYTSSALSGRTAMNAKVDAPGSFVLTAPTAALYIATNETDFKEGTTGTFWSSTTPNTYANTETKQIINSLKVTGGSSDTIYKCTYTLNVSTTGLPLSEMKSGEYVVYISGVDDKVLDMSDERNRNKSYIVHRYLMGTTGKTLTASAKLVNTDSVQNHLQDLTITTTFTTSNLNCEPVSSAGADTMEEFVN